MSKHLKAFIVALLTVCMTACLGIFAAACDNKPDDEFPTSISITVKLPDNTPAQGIWVQLCVVGADNTLGACLEPVETNAQGVATVTKGIEKEYGKIYEVHLTGVPTEYQYVDANGTPYEKTKGKHVDITDTSTLTITLKAAPAPDPEITLKTGNNSLEFKQNAPVEATIDLGKDTKAVGYYSIKASEAFNLTGTGLNVANTYAVGVYLKNGDKLSLSLADGASATYPCTLNVGLIALDDGSSEKPLAADAGSTFVLNLEAGKTVYISNVAMSMMNRAPVAVDVDGTNFKANYKQVNYTEKFTVDAEGVFTVGTANGAAGVVTLKFTEHEDIADVGTQDNPYVAQLNVALDVAFVTGQESLYVQFSASKSTTYTISYSADGYVSDGGNNLFESSGSGEAGSVDVILEAGQVILFNVDSYNYTPNGTVTITITEKA